MTHEQEEHVRRVLGSLPPEDPTPPAVATRLDATLADLVAERRPDIADDELAARRRRRRLATGLVAAASVAVIGIGLGTVAQLGGDGESALPGQAASEAGGDAAAREVAPREATDGGATGDLPDGVRYLAGGREEVSSATLERDVARVAALAPVATSGEGLSTDRLAPSGRRSGLAALAPCGVPAAAAGDLVAPVRLDGEPATLVLRREADGAREAQIYSCADPGALLASTTLQRR